MWLSKFVDLEEDWESLKKDIRDKIFKKRDKKTLTPLEFTILEQLFNKDMAGYDLIQSLNDHFAGTWNATSGTVYPILSRLKDEGFLNSKKVKSPIGPLKKVYCITEAGAELVKLKINKNFLDQLKFIENFVVELSSIYIETLPEEELKEKLKTVQDLLKRMFNNVLNALPRTVGVDTKCSECGTDIIRENAAFCSVCGADLPTALSKEEDDQFLPTEELHNNSD